MRLRDLIILQTCSLFFCFQPLIHYFKVNLEAYERYFLHGANHCLYVSFSVGDEELLPDIRRILNGTAMHLFLDKQQINLTRSANELKMFEAIYLIPC